MRRTIKIIFLYSKLKKNLIYPKKHQLLFGTKEASEDLSIVLI